MAQQWMAQRARLPPIFHPAGLNALTLRSCAAGPRAGYQRGCFIGHRVVLPPRTGAFCLSCSFPIVKLDTIQTELTTTEGSCHQARRDANFEATSRAGHSWRLAGAAPMSKTFVRCSVQKPTVKGATVWA
jgi:hypothetical protein